MGETCWLDFPGMSLAEYVWLKRAHTQANSARTRLDIRWGIPNVRQASRVCQAPGCTLGKDGGPKHLDATNGTGFCRDHWRFSKSSARRQLPLKIVGGG